MGNTTELFSNSCLSGRTTEQGENKWRELLENLLGDILPVRMVMGSLGGGITNPLVHLMGMEAVSHACRVPDFLI